MSVLGFVFCTLTILSFSALLSLERQVSAYRLRSSFLGHIAAHRQILDQATSELYASLKHISLPAAKDQERQEENEPQNQQPSLPPPINPHCARLNLSPLIEQDSVTQECLYEVMARMLKVFYHKTLFEGKIRMEYKFLDALLHEMREQISRGESLILEKISFKDPSFRRLYYKMLKGTKVDNWLNEESYPSLLDYIKVDSSASRICLPHAHPRLLSIFFTPKGALQLYASLHTPKAPAVTRETIEQICQEVRAPLLGSEILDLFEMQQKNHGKSARETMIGTDPDGQVFLKKVVALS